MPTCEDQWSSYFQHEENTVGSQPLPEESLEGGDHDSENTPLLPIFSAVQLGRAAFFRPSI